MSIDQEIAREDDIPDDYWEETEAAKKLNAIFANQVYVQHLGSSLLRINLGESLDEEPRYHTAIVMTAANAYQFGALLMRMAEATLPKPEVIVPPPPPMRQTVPSGETQDGGE